jgi:hypothetical protein
MSEPIWVSVDLAKGPDKTLLSVIRDGIDAIFNVQLQSLRNMERVLTEATKRDREMREKLAEMEK